MNPFEQTRRGAREGLFLGHPLPDPSVESGVIHRSFVEPCPQVLGHPVDRDASRARSVAALLNRRRPTAVIGGVGAVVVDAVERVLGGWSAPHVGKEILVCAPPIADANPAASVSWKRLVSWVFTPVSSTRPNPELHCFPGCLAVGNKGKAERTHVIGLGTPARRGFSRSQRGAAADGPSAAHTDTFPARLPGARGTGLRNNRQTTKNFPDHVYFCHVGTMTQER